MKIVLALLLFAPSIMAAQTMRLDYFHTGNAKQELFSIDRVVVEPLPWPGNPAKAIDTLNLGKYFFEVRDQASKRVLYSRGFASIFGEWETTDEARKMFRTFIESLRFPAPDAPVEIILRKRDPKNEFRDVWSTTVDPKDIFIDRSKQAAPAPLITIQKAGEPANKVDLLILGDGYTAAEAQKFEKDARRLTEVLFATSPFKEHRESFNVWGLCPPSNESGISRPSTGTYRDSPLGATYDAFGSERYVLSFDNRAVRKVAQFAPYEFIEILANNRTYGGGGIFNLYSTVAADNAFANYVFVHEFGHHFAGLADEYYTSSVAYAPSSERVEPWEPNATALLDPANLKWKDLVDPDTPIPTPWNKEAFETYSREIQKRRAQLRKDKRPEREMESLFREELQYEQALFAKEKYAGKVGAFEGALYESRGYYRPEIDCIMFTRTNHFCAVCRRAIERIIAMYSNAAAQTSPSPSQVTSINDYCRGLATYAKQNLRIARFFGDVASYDQNSMTLTAPPANWKEFKSQKARDNSGNGDNLYNTANVWTKNGNLVLANLEYGSPSGDWGQFVSYCFREDGSLAKLTDTFRSFFGSISTVKEKVYDARGTRLKSSISCYDLDTKRRKRCSSDYSNYDAHVYRRVSQLPIYPTFKSGKKNN